MTRRCSHCSNNGHNSRTCPTRAGGGGGASGGVRLFGVRLIEGGLMKKSASMSCLSHFSSSAQASPNPGDSPSSDLLGDHGADQSGYASDDPNHASCSSNRRAERKKGIPWTEEEHRMFLVGLQKLGKGDWRGIARNYVVSRTPTQVASHAQKYFIRQTNATRRKRRSSLFDMVPEMPMDHVAQMEEQFLLRSPPAELENSNSLPSLELTLERECIPSEPVADNQQVDIKENTSCTNLPPMMPAFYPAYMPVPFPFWPPDVNITRNEEVAGEAHEVLKPVPMLPRDSTHADDLVRMSKLSLGDAGGSRMEPSALSSKLRGASSTRQSAFHANPPVAGSDLSPNSGSAIHAL